MHHYGDCVIVLLVWGCSHAPGNEASCWGNPGQSHYCSAPTATQQLMNIERWLYLHLFLCTGSLWASLRRYNHCLSLAMLWSTSKNILHSRNSKWKGKSKIRNDSVCAPRKPKIEACVNECTGCGLCRRAGLSWGYSSASSISPGLMSTAAGEVSSVCWLCPGCIQNQLLVPDPFSGIHCRGPYSRASSVALL